MRHTIPSKRELQNRFGVSRRQAVKVRASMEQDEEMSVGDALVELREGPMGRLNVHQA